MPREDFRHAQESLASAVFGDEITLFNAFAACCDNEILASLSLGLHKLKAIYWPQNVPADDFKGLACYFLPAEKHFSRR